MFIKSQLNKTAQDGLLPLNSVQIDVIIEGAFATCDLDLEYRNPSSDCALEATYEFPLE